MELRWLEDFVALARIRHFSRAAEEQHVTQPTFSRRIKLLEEAVGTPLIDRNTLPLSLTPAGEVFLKTAQDVAQRIRQTRAQCMEIHNREAARLNFATTQTLYLSLYKRLEPYAQQFGVDVELNLRSTAWAGMDFVSALQQGECDLMLCYWHPAINIVQALDAQQFESLKVADETLIPVSATDAAGQTLFTLPGKQQQPLPYIAYHNHSFLSSLLQEVLLEDGFAHLVIMNENRHASSVSAMIREGFGLGWVPRRLVKRDLQTGTLQLAGDERWHIPLEVRLYRSKQGDKASLEVFWARLRAYLGG